MKIPIKTLDPQTVTSCIPMNKLLIGFIVSGGNNILSELIPSSGKVFVDANDTPRKNIVPNKTAIMCLAHSKKRSFILIERRYPEACPSLLIIALVTYEKIAQKKSAANIR